MNNNNIELVPAIIAGLKFLISNDSGTFKIYPECDEYSQKIYVTINDGPIVINGVVTFVQYIGSGADDRGNFIILKKKEKYENQQC